MAAWYIASWGKAAGKSTLCWGVARELQRRDKKVGFSKPVRVSESEMPSDGDVEFAQQVLGLKETAETLCPFSLTLTSLQTELTKKEEFRRKLQESFDLISPGKEIVLVEGVGSLDEGDIQAQACYESAVALNARVIVTVRYSVALPWKKFFQACKKFRQDLVGIVVNFVPRKKLELETTRIASLCAAEGVRLLGVLPEERLLLTVSIGELAAYLQGEIITEGESKEELVENMMIGAASSDCGLDYFQRRGGKVVITRGSRPDLQLAALATSTKALILSENVPPIDQVRHWAEEKRVLVMVVKQDTLSTVAKVEEVLANARFRQKRKLEKLDEILKQHFDFGGLFGGP